MRRYRFSDVFQMNPDGSISPKRRVSINGVSFGSSVSFSRGVSFGGVNLHQYINFDIQGEEIEGVLIIRGFYR